MTDSIKTHSNQSFQDKYVQPESKADAFFKIEIGKFFIIRIEDVMPMVRLPVPPIRSTNCILLYLTEGEATLSVGSETYKIGRNECLFVPAGQVYSVEHTSFYHTRGYLCNFHNDFMSGWFGNTDLLKDYVFLRVWGNPRILIDDPTADFITHVFSRMLLHYTTFGLTQPVLLQAHFITLLSEINHVYQSASARPQTYAVVITNRFKELLFSHRNTHHSVAAYANLLNITPNHLNKAVRSVTGKSPIKWIDEAIVLEAKVLLYQTDLSIGEVAAQVGISDPSYFSRLFKKYAEVTPLGFRKRIEIV